MAVRHYSGNEGIQLYDNSRPRLYELIGIEAPPWMNDVVCATTDPEVFFPERGGASREAKRVCLGCGVREECLQWAIDNDERHGVWGGMSEHERKRFAAGRPVVLPVCALAECDLVVASRRARFCGKPHAQKAASRRYQQRHRTAS